MSLAAATSFVLLCFALFPAGVWGAELQQWLSASGGVGDGSFGWSVAADFDLNGDGYGDVAVGAPRSDFGSVDGGRVYVFFGGKSVDVQADLILTGTAGEQLGWSVASAGDVDGDGYEDLVVGANGNDARGTDAGRAYVFRGGPAPDGVADFAVTGEAAEDELGRWVAGAGDWNADGYDDLVVGAPFHDGAAPNCGRAYVLWGGPGFDAVPDVVLDGEAAFDEYGRSVAIPGDLTGDGLHDLVVAAPGDGAGNPGGGRVFVYAGAKSPSTRPHAVLVGSGNPGDGFGWIVTGAGDHDADGILDLAAGEPFHDGAGPSSGRLFLFSGGHLTAPATLLLEGERGGDQYGRAVAGVGDVSGDGVDDLLVGAHRRRAGGADAGRLYLYHGSSAPDVAADWILSGSAGQQMGFSIAFAGDVDGDNAPDVAVGSLGAPGSVELFRAEGIGVPAVTLRVWAARQGEGVVLRWDVGGAGDLEFFQIERRQRQQRARVMMTLHSPHVPSQGHWIDRAASREQDLRYEVQVGLATLAMVFAAVDVSSSPAISLPSLRAFPNPFRGEVRLTAPAAPGEMLWIQDVRGRRIRQLPLGASWDGRDHSGRPVAAGAYRVGFLRPGLAAPVALFKLP